MTTVTVSVVAVALFLHPSTAAPTAAYYLQSEASHAGYTTKTKNNNNHGQLMFDTLDSDNAQELPTYTPPNVTRREMPQ